MSKILIVKEAAEKAIAAESDRTVHLLRQAGMFAAGIIILTGFQLLDANTLLESSSQWVKILCCLSLAILGLSLFFAFLAIRLNGYADYPRGNKLWDNLKPENVSEDAAQEALVQMLLKTREQNAQLNDAKVNSLFWCGWLLFVGFLLGAGGQLLDAFLNASA
ncbi:MAG: hypothetical protein ABR955_02305 [Verrucomicrobiota bacterium]|jgi:hypothetical protein